jgi:glycosyltransferase involved in cell wall biosynthesis
MDGGSILKEYGNTDLPEGTEERPLVTFVLFAYNQEKYIREAIEGAFSQNYSPLEIILSDDCSSDRTFEIMEEMAREYRGTHRVVVRRNRENLGTYSHVLAAAQISKGKILVLAAGDDISKPNRTEEIHEASKDNDAWAFQSCFDSVDELGNVLSISQRSESLFSSDNEFNKYFLAADGPVYVVHGATSAYRRELIEVAPRNENKILSEDGVFTIILNLKKKRAAFIEKSLVKYRTHPGAITNARLDVRSANITAFRHLLDKQSIYAKNIADRSLLALNFSAKATESLRPLNEPYLRDQIIIQRAKYLWRTLSPRQRLVALQAAMRWRRAGYILPSILGPRIGPFYLWLRYRLAR